MANNGPDPRLVNVWTGRIIPIVLAGVVGYATYVTVARLCIDYLLRSSNPRPGAAIVLLVLYFILLLLMSITYLRLLYTTAFDPAVAPLGPEARRNNRHPSPADRDDVDSAGLEMFYSRDVFVCEGDGKPRWCDRCQNWRADRTHHSSDVGRCVMKFDHFCPWVGGVVAENNFKFFLQFVVYTWMYCFFLIPPFAIYLHEQIVTPGADFDGQFIAMIALAAFFGSFTFGMTFTAGKDALSNCTTIDNLNRVRSWTLAIYIPPRATGKDGQTVPPYNTVTYPLPPSHPAMHNFSHSTHKGSNQPAATESQNMQNSLETLSSRDARATRTFAILTLEAGLNPWDLGPKKNWESVMGTRVIDWILPIRHSPCRNHDSGSSRYPIGQWVEQMMVQYGLMSPDQISMPKPFFGGNIAAANALKSVELLQLDPRTNRKKRRRWRRRSGSHRQQVPDKGVGGESG